MLHLSISIDGTNMHLIWKRWVGGWYVSLK